MKTILLLRHGKSDWNAAYGADRERPLNKRGRAAAERMGRFLSEVGPSPELVVTSTAERARATVALAAQAGGWRCPVRAAPELYDSSPDAVLAVIGEQEDEHDSMLLAGHEPTWSDLASLLVGGGRIRVPTAALARIDLPVARWRDVRFGHGELQWLVTPRLLAQSGP